MFDNSDTADSPFDIPRDDPGFFGNNEPKSSGGRTMRHR